MNTFHTDFYIILKNYYKLYNIITITNYYHHLKDCFIVLFPSSIRSCGVLLQWYKRRTGLQDLSLIVSISVVDMAQAPLSRVPEYKSHAYHVVVFAT
jgi:hypothetical protein